MVKDDLGNEAIMVDYEWERHCDWAMRFYIAWRTKSNRWLLLVVLAANRGDSARARAAATAAILADHAEWIREMAADAEPETKTAFDLHEALGYADACAVETGMTARRTPSGPAQFGTIEQEMLNADDSGGSEGSPAKIWASAKSEEGAKESPL